MIESIIRASSLEGSLVLDFFCGSGTTLLAAQKLRRRWIGIDASEIAISATKNKLLQNGVPAGSFSMPTVKVEEEVLVLREEKPLKKKIKKA